MSQRICPRGTWDPLVPSFVTFPITPCLSPPTSLAHIFPIFKVGAEGSLISSLTLGTLEVLTSPAALPAGWCAVGHPAASGSSVSPQGSSNRTAALWTGLKHTDRYGSQQTKGTRRRSLHHDRGGSWGQGPPEQTPSPKPRTSENLFNADYSCTIPHQPEYWPSFIAPKHQVSSQPGPCVEPAGFHCGMNFLQCLHIPTRSSHECFSNLVGLSISVQSKLQCSVSTWSLSFCITDEDLECIGHLEASLC